MISISLDQWIDIQEEYFDDSAGPVDNPEFDVEIDDHVVLTFDSPQAETYFRLRYIKE
jgi:hypothetical protein